MLSILRQAALAVLVLGPMGVDQSPLPPPAPATATLALRLTAEKSTYRLGEEIPVAFDLSGQPTSGLKYSISACRQWGRPTDERIAITPADGVSDSRATELSISGAFGGSCAYSHWPLTPTPYVVRATLNDWVRFSRPGTYHVSVISIRVSDQSNSRLSLTSAPVTVTITPRDDSWAATEVIRAEHLIAEGGKDDVQHGAAILRYLDTEAAAQAVVAHYDAIEAAGGDGFGALCGSTYLAAVLPSLEARVDRGEALDGRFLSLLATLRLLVDLPPIPGDYAVRQVRTKAIEADYDARWQAALLKQPVTVARLATELARLGQYSGPAFERATADDLAAHPAEAAAAFLEAPLTRQQNLLGSSAWPLLNRPWIVPVLRAAYANWYYTAQYAPPDVGEPALGRLYEVEPAEGRKLMLEEMRTGAHEVSDGVLAVLPDPVLPELDQALRTRYLRTDLAAPLRDRDRTTTGWLIMRYGSPALLPLALAQAAVPASCNVEAPMLAYLLKHDPVDGLKDLDPAVPWPTRGCVAPPLGEVATHYWDASVERAAVEVLASDNPAWVSQAAYAFQQHASSTGKQRLLDRLATWSQQWKGRASEIRPTGFNGMAPIEGSLVGALTADAAFELTRDDLARMRDLCVTDACRRTVDDQARRIKSAQDVTSPQNPPVFRAGVNLIEMDVSVLDKNRRPGAKAGLSRHVEVKVDRPDVEVLARDGYYTSGPGASASSNAPAATTADPLAGPLPIARFPLELAVAPFAGVASSTPTAEVALHVTEPGIPWSRNDVLQIEARAYSADGDQEQTQKQTVRWAPQSGKTGDREGTTVLRMDASPGYHQVRVAVRSAALGSAASVFAEVDVPDFAREPVSLSGLVIAAGVAEARSAGPPPSAIAALPSTTRVFATSDRVRASLSIYQGARGRLAPVTMTTLVRSERDQTVFTRSEIVAVDRFITSNRRADWAVDLPLSSLTPGTYLLTIEAVAGDRHSQRDVTFRVR